MGFDSGIGFFRYIQISTGNPNNLKLNNFCDIPDSSTPTVPLIQHQPEKSHAGSENAGCSIKALFKIKIPFVGISGFLSKNRDSLFIFFAVLQFYYLTATIRSKTGTYIPAAYQSALQ
jgi:hypothetical protein